MKFPVLKSIFVLLFSLLSISSFSQENSYAKFRHGTFKTKGVRGEEYLITRKDGKQIESNATNQDKYEFFIEWINDYTYTLTPDSDTQTKLHLPANTVLSVSIVKLTEHSYKYKCRSNFSLTKTKGKVVQLTE